jgi:hypothetical protein
MKMKASYMSGQQKMWWIVIFLSGILLALLFGEEYMTENPLSTYHLNNFVARTSDNTVQFAEILWERGKLFGILFLLCVSTRRRWMGKVIPAVLVFSLGIYGGICLACQGLAGIGIFFFSLLPQGPVYLFAVYLVLHKKKPIQYSGKRYILTEIVSVFFLLALILTGCFLEATVGNYLLKQYLLLFIGASS